MAVVFSGFAPDFVSSLSEMRLAKFIIRERRLYYSVSFHFDCHYCHFRCYSVYCCVSGFCCLCVCCFAGMGLEPTIVNDDFAVEGASLGANLEVVWLSADWPIRLPPRP